MTTMRAIYVINQLPELVKAWRELSQIQKRAVINACQTAEEDELERILMEVTDGQRRLF